MLRCSILAIFGLLLPLDAQTTTGRGGSGPSASADQKRDRKQCSAATDDNLMTRLAPHPYVYVAPSIMPAGYALAAIRAEAGLNVESCHSVANARGAYDNGRAANGTDPPNAKGHDRYLDADSYFRLNRLFSGRSFFGVGWRWNQRSTTNWTKTANRPQFGGGYDWIQPLRDLQPRFLDAVRRELVHGWQRLAEWRTRDRDFSLDPKPARNTPLVLSRAS